MAEKPAGDAASPEARLAAAIADPRRQEQLIDALDRIEAGGSATDAEQLTPLTSSAAENTSSRKVTMGAVSFAAEMPLLRDVLDARDQERREEDPSPDDDDDGDDALPDEVVDAKELYRSIQRELAAVKIQDAFRVRQVGHDPMKVIEALHLDEYEDAEPPQIAEAKRVAKAERPHHDNGSLYSWKSEPLRSLDTFGVEIAVYQRFITFAGRAFWIALLLNLSNIISNLEFGKAGDILGAGTSLSNADCLGMSYGVVEAATSLLFVGFTFWMRGEMKATTKRIQDAAASDQHLDASNFSVLATNCPAGLCTKEAIGKFRALLQEKYGDVVHVGVALNNRELIHAMQKRARLLYHRQVKGMELLRAMSLDRERRNSYTSTTHNGGGAESATAPSAAHSSSTTRSAPPRKVPSAVRRAQRAFNLAQGKLLAFERSGRVRDLLSKKYHCTGTCFITFNATETARQCIASRNLVFMEHSITLRAPPPPDMIIWENLQVGPWERVFRQALSTTLLLIATVIGAAVIALTTWIKPNVEQLFSPECMANVSIADQILGQGGRALQAANVSDAVDACGVSTSEREMQSCALTFFQTLPVLVGSTVFIILGHIIIFILAPVLSVAIERPHFFFHRELSVFVKLAGFQVFNVLASMFLMLQRDSNLGGWLDHVAPLIINVIVGDTVVINLGIDCLRPDILVRRYLLAPRKKTQFDMNETYTIDADIWLAFRLQLAAKVILLSMMFSSAIPLLLGLVGVFCWTAQFVDRYVLFRLMRRPPRTLTPRLVYIVIGWLMPTAVLVRLGFAFFSFLWLKCGCDVDDGFAGEFRPVQVIVMTSSCALAIPMLFYLLREAWEVRCCASKRHKVTNDGSRDLRSLKGGVRHPGLSKRSNTEMSLLSRVKSTGDLLGKIATTATTLVQPTRETVEQLPRPLRRAKSSGAFIRAPPARPPMLSTVSRANSSADLKLQASKKSRGSAGSGSVPERAVSFGRSVSFKLNTTSSCSLRENSTNRLSGGGRSRAETADSQATFRSKASSKASSIHSHARAASFSKKGIMSGLSRPRTSSGGGGKAYELPDAMQMYLPPLTMQIMSKLVVIDPIVVQRAKKNAERSQMIVRSNIERNNEARSRGNTFSTSRRLSTTLGEIERMASVEQKLSGRI